MLVDVSTDIDGRDRRLVRSDLAGTMQLCELGNNDTVRPVTDLPEPVGSAAHVPVVVSRSSRSTRAATSATSSS
jgi:hypothetical protein